MYGLVKFVNNFYIGVFMRRICKKGDSGSGGCLSMCCGRGYRSRVIEVQYRCDCKYYWCCYVKCRTCTRSVQVSRCHWTGRTTLCYW